MNRILKAMYALAGYDPPEDEDESLYEEAEPEPIEIDEGVLSGIWKIAAIKRVPVTYLINRTLAAEICKKENAEIIAQYDRFFAGHEENELRAIRNYQATLKTGKTGGNVFGRFNKNAE